MAYEVDGEGVEIGGAGGPVAVGWRKSSGSMNEDDCVEVQDLRSGTRQVRDTKNRAGAMLSIGPAGWGAFIGAVKDGQLV